jgi:cephalosporin-C deacetylase-like acetyl esterase
MSEKKMARRKFLKQSSALIAASSLADVEAFSEIGSETGQSQYRGPLADYDLSDRQFDTLDFSLSSYRAVKPSMNFSATNERSARLWQKRARSRLTELVGGFPVRVALRPRVLEKKQMSGYAREKIVFQSRDDLSVFGYLLLPDDRPRPLPAIICLPGHGRGCDDIVGIAQDGSQREAKSGYAKDFALQAVEQGYAALAIEQLAFGCRRDGAARKRGPEQSSCQPSAGVALLLGQTMIGWRVWDVMRAIDYLLTRSEIASSRIATMGISGGGTISLFAAAMDERIRAAVVSGYFNTFRDCIVSLSHCIDNYVPGILNYFEMPDLAGMIAPRPLFIESGTRDPIFPVEGTKTAFRRARQIYSVFNATARLDQEIFDGGHEFYGKGAFGFLKKNL